MNILEVKNLDKTFDNKKILQDISFNIPSGKIIGFINQYEFLTSRQIFQLLQLNNIEIKNQDKSIGLFV